MSTTKQISISPTLNGFKNYQKLQRTIIYKAKQFLSSNFYSYNILFSYVISVLNHFLFLSSVPLGNKV